MTRAAPSTSASSPPWSRPAHRAVMVYLVQRADCAHFTLAADLDPAYAGAFARARAAGVEAVCYDCAITPEGIEVARPLAIRIAAA